MKICKFCNLHVGDIATEVFATRIPSSIDNYNDLTLADIGISTIYSCAGCARRQAWVCHNGKGKTCNNSNYDQNSTRFTVGNYSVCLFCYVNNYVQCTRCRIYFVRTESEEEFSLIKEEGYCKTCTKAIETIMIKENTYKPKAKFYKSAKEEDSPLFYGIELEVNCQEEMSDPVLKAMNKAHVYLKYDGSIGVGFEIVTHPHSFSAQKELWKKFFSEKFHLKGMTSYKSKRCGMHIHMSKDAFTQDHLARFVLFINNKENVAFITSIAQRKEGQWAKLDPNKKADRLVPISKYEAVNLSPKKTIEVRIFRGSVRKDRFFKNLEFVDSLYHYTANNSSLNNSNYIDWLNKNKKTKYPYLFKYLKEKEFIKEEVECQTTDQNPIGIA